MGGAAGDTDGADCFGWLPLPPLGLGGVRDIGIRRMDDQKLDEN
jgi:hypothetical protein